MPSASSGSAAATKRSRRGQRSASHPSSGSLTASASRVADASAGSQAQAGTAGSTGMDRLEPYRNELESFCSAIKFRTEPACTGAAALAAAIVILKANEAVETRRPVDLDDSLYRV